MSNKSNAPVINKQTTIRLLHVFRDNQVSVRRSLPNGKTRTAEYRATWLTGASAERLQRVLNHHEWRKDVTVEDDLSVEVELYHAGAPRLQPLQLEAGKEEPTPVSVK